MKKMMTMMMAAVVLYTAQANVWYVTPDGTDGLDWAGAVTLETALEEATTVGGGDLYLAGGTYINSGAVTFTIPANVTLYGGYDADTGLREGSASILDGNGQGIAVVTINGGAGTSITLDGIVITGALGGGGVRGISKSVNGNLTLVDCVISNNVLTSSVGSGSSPAASLVNGHDDIITLRRCVIADNGRRGGDSNHSSGSAANGIRSDNGTLIIEECQFSRQFCNPWDARSLGAGALWFIGKTLRVTDTLFEENNAAPHGNGAAGGGAVRIGGVSEGATFSNCLFRANGFAYDSRVTEGAGGAILIYNTGVSSPIGFYQCTFVDNFVGNGNGGALFMNSGAVTLRNCIFWNNTVTQPAFSGSEICRTGGSLDGDYLCITSLDDPAAVSLGGFSLGSNIITDDPLFADDFRLQSQMGRWDSVLQDWVTDEVTSPCIDAGDPACNVGEEPVHNGGRINLGYTAGTAEASKSLMSEPPLVDILTPTFVDYTRWSLGGKLTNSVLNAANVIIYYGTNPILEETAEGWDAVIVLPLPVSSESPFTAVTPFLETDTDYYVRVYATNTFGEAWSDIKTFKTGNSLPEGWGVGGGAGVVHVRASAVGDNDGSDWYNAFTSISDGFATLGGIRTNLWIAKGTYTLAANTIVSGNYDILGGFAGTETSPGERATNTTGRTVSTTVVRGGPFAVTLNANAGMLDNVTFTDFAVVPALRRDGSGNFTLSHFTFTNNVAPSGSAGNQGLIRFVGGNVTMRRCTVSDNKSAYWDLNDYGIRVDGGTSLSVFDSDISRNRGNTPWNARGAYSFGISFRGTTLLIERTRFSGNEICFHNAYGAAALYLAGSGSAVLRNCLFDGNRVASWTEGNGSTHGSAVSVNMGNVLIANCTFAGNTSVTMAAGEGAVFVQGGAPVLKNNIFWANTRTTSGVTHNADLYVNAGTAVLGYNSFTSEDPLSVNTGNTLPETTIFVDPLFVGNGDYHLQSKEGYWDDATSTWKKAKNNSPCIDAGDKADGYSFEPMPNGRRINLGAYGNTPYASKTQDHGTILIIR